MTFLTQRYFKVMRSLIVVLMLVVPGLSGLAQTPWWKQGITVDEFIYDTAPYPECHAATIAETPEGLVAAWFGGTKERNPDVCIWVSRLENGKWTPSVEVANGVQNDTLRYPTWNPVLFQIPNGELMLFYKIGPSPSTWWGMLMKSSDHGKTWGKRKNCPKGISGR
jgi:predicted neuraminidase